MREATNCLIVEGDIEKTLELMSQATKSLQLMSSRKTFPKETSKRSFEKQPRGFFPRKKKRRLPLKKPTLTVLQEFLKDISVKDPAEDRDWALILSFPEKTIDSIVMTWNEEELKKWRRRQGQIGYVPYAKILAMPNFKLIILNVVYTKNGSMVHLMEMRIQNVILV